MTVTFLLGVPATFFPTGREGDVSTIPGPFSLPQDVTGHVEVGFFRHKSNWWGLSLNVGATHAEAPIDFTPEVSGLPTEGNGFQATAFKRTTLDAALTLDLLKGPIQFQVGGVFNGKLIGGSYIPLKGFDGNVKANETLGVTATITADLAPKQPVSAILRATGQVGSTGIEDATSDTKLGPVLTYGGRVELGLAFRKKEEKRKKGKPEKSDRDGDGFLDKADRCPSEPQVGCNRGCPVVTQTYTIPAQKTFNLNDTGLFEGSSIEDIATAKHSPKQDELTPRSIGRSGNFTVTLARIPKDDEKLTVVVTDRDGRKEIRKIVFEPATAAPAPAEKSFYETAVAITLKGEEKTHSITPWNSDALRDKTIQSIKVIKNPSAGTLKDDDTYTLTETPKTATEVVFEIIYRGDPKPEQRTVTFTADAEVTGGVSVIETINGIFASGTDLDFTKYSYDKRTGVERDQGLTITNHGQLPQLPELIKKFVDGGGDPAKLIVNISAYSSSHVSDTVAEPSTRQEAGQFLNLHLARTRGVSIKEYLETELDTLGITGVQFAVNAYDGVAPAHPGEIAGVAYYNSDHKTKPGAVITVEMTGDTTTAATPAAPSPATTTTAAFSAVGTSRKFTLRTDEKKVIQTASVPGAPSLKITTSASQIEFTLGKNLKNDATLEVLIQYTDGTNELCTITFTGVTPIVRDLAPPPSTTPASRSEESLDDEF